MIKILGYFILNLLGNGDNLKYFLIDYNIKLKCIFVIFNELNIVFIVF